MDHQFTRRTVTLIGMLALIESTAGGQSLRSPAANVLSPVPAKKNNVVTVVAHDFAFDVPASIPSGLTTFRLVNKGKWAHHLTVMRLGAGKTAADGLAALIKAGQGVRPAWLHAVGGPNAIDAGGQAEATVNLPPGNYLAFCEVPGPDPAPHFMKGMVKGFTVTPPDRIGTLPNADLNLRMTEYDYVFSRPLTRGHHVIAVTNAGKQKHMLVITRLAPGKSNKEFLDWAYDPKGKHEPGWAASGVTEIEPGATAVMEGNFAPGKYSLVCFSPDVGDGKPHFMHGMQKEIVVK